MANFREPYDILLELYNEWKKKDEKNELLITEAMLKAIYDLEVKSINKISNEEVEEERRKEIEDIIEKKIKENDN